MTSLISSQSSTGSTFSLALNELSAAQKPGGGVPAYMRWVNRYLARFPAAAAFVLGISPTTLTMISLALSISGVTLVAAAPRTIPAGICAALCFATAFVLDSSDGQLARLSKTAGPAGEWLDHVVDAARTPMVHLGVAIGSARSIGLDWWLLVPLAFCLVGVTQSHSQMLAEQLNARRGATKPTGGGNLQSWLLLPTDTGVLCWSFVLWGLPQIFGIWYAFLAVTALAHSAISMRRRYRGLSSIIEQSGKDAA